MIDIEKFICSLIHRSSGFCVIKVIDIIDALHFQGLDYKDGNIIRVTPEIKESDDGRIRKCIKDLIKENTFSNIYGVTKDDCLAWFEKQGEKGVVLKDTFGYEDGRQRGREEGIMLVLDNPQKYGLEKQGKQKIVWSEEDTATISRVISIVKWAAYSDHSHPILNDKGATELVERLESLKERCTWKPTDAQIASLTIACDRNDRVGFDLTQLLRDLKKLMEK